MKANALAIIITALYCLFLDWSRTWSIFDGIKAHIVYFIMCIATVCFVIVASSVCVFLKEITRKS